MDGLENRKTGQDYEFAQLSDAEIQNLKTTEEKINRDQAKEVVLIAYQKSQEK